MRERICYPLTKTRLATPYPLAARTAEPKTFRTTVATIVKRESSTDAAKEQLGHSSTAVTEGSYIQAAHEGPDVTDILEKFNVRAPKQQVNSEQGPDEER